MQLTPTFRIGAMQLRPISDIVTMRLTTPQDPQCAGNVQRTFEVAEVQPIVGGFGRIRLAPSERDKSSIIGQRSFAVAGLHVGSNGEGAPIQVTPAQEASVLVTAGFQIASVEFSPSFELVWILLNSSGREVTVQLPGVRSVEAIVRFEVVHLQLGSSGEIGMLQLNLLEQPATRTPQVCNEARVENANEVEPLEDGSSPIVSRSIDEDAHVRLRPAHQQNRLRASADRLKSILNVNPL
jgi:hypothetical protein